MINDSNEQTRLIHPSEIYDDCCCYFPRRYLLVFCLFLATFNIYALRTSLSIAIVSMGKQYGWDESNQTLILSAFFWGYVVFQVMGGWVATRFGGKRVLLVALLLASLFTLLTPIVADRCGLIGVFILRLCVGFAEGPSYPAMHALLSRWAPPLERTRMTSISYSGAFVGTIVALAVGGALGLRWTLNFYIFGVAGIAWSLLWLILGSSTPAESSSIRKAELNYILTTLNTTATAKIIIPWKAIVTNLPFIALTIVQLCGSFAFYTCLTLTPTFIAKCLHYSLENSGFLSMLPQIGTMIFYYISGFAADRMIVKGVSVTKVRRLFNALSFVLSGAAFFSIGFVKTPEFAVGLLTAAVTFMGFSAGATVVNHLDLGGPLGGVLMSIANSFAAFAGVLAPLIAGAIIGNDDSNPEKWKIVFIVTAGQSFFAAIFFQIFSSGDRQF